MKQRAYRVTFVHAVENYTEAAIVVVAGDGDKAIAKAREHLDLPEYWALRGVQPRFVGG